MNVVANKQPSFPRAERSYVTRMQAVLLSLLGLGYVLLQFFSLPLLQTAISVLIFLFILWVLPTARGMNFIVSFVLFATGVVLMVGHHASFTVWMEAARMNLTLIAIFLFVPLLGIPIRQGGYVEALKTAYQQKMNNAYFLYVASQILTHALGIVLNVGSVPIVHYLSSGSAIRSVRLVANAIDRAFSSVIFWSPYTAAMALVLHPLSVSWASIVLYALGLTVISFVVSFLLNWRLISRENKTVRDVQPSSTGSAEGLKQAKRKVTELFGLLFFMMGIVLVIESFTSYGMILIICMVSVFLPLAWAVLLRKEKEYAAEIKRHFSFTIPGMRKEISLFLIAGFFSGAIVQADISPFLVHWLLMFSNSSPTGITFFITVFMIITAIMGLHPIIFITIFATSIQPQTLGLTPEFFALLLLGSWGISNAISPATAVNNLLSILCKTDIMTISIRWNIRYVIVMCILFLLYMMFIKQTFPL